MKRTFLILALALLVLGALPAATISTTLTVNATASLSGVNYTIAGTANFTGSIGNGNISSTGSLASLSGTNAVGDYTITLASGGTLTGKLTVPITVLTGGATPSASVSLTVTNGTGTYVGATSGTTPITLTGSVTGDLLSGFKLNNFAGPATITTGGTPPPAVPTITAVQDAASNTANIAQGSIFVVKGTTLSPVAPLASFAPPRPTQSSGVKVTFTPVSGGTGTDAYLVYLYNQGGVNQIAAILPSTVAAGSYNVTVTNGTVSAPFAAQVVASKLGLFTQDSSGTGLASVQNYVVSSATYDLNRLTTGAVGGVTISPAKPGQVMVAYGTGLGAYAAGDNTASPAFDFSKTLNIQAVVGGVNIPVAYAGRAGYAGEDQLNFTLPSDIPTGCAVSLQISVNGKLSAPTSIAIAPDANAATCVLPGYTTAQLQKLDQGGTITTGAFSITQFTLSAPSIGTEKINSIAGGFSQLTAYQLSSAAQANVNVIQSGSCQVIQATSNGTTTSTGSLTYLDAGAVTITGPAGSSLTNQALNKSSNSYSLTNIEGFAIPGQTVFSLPAGGYTLNGAGGTDVGSFSTSITLASALTLSNPLPANVVRSSPLTLNWTGGNSSDLVEIIGSSSTSTGTGLNTVTTSTTFICITTAGQKTFTVPASILTQLPASTSNNPGILEVASGNNSTTFTAPLKAGGTVDPAYFGSFLGIGTMPTYQ
jgi:uncharacterized protein (TIGR03437 family)